MDILVDIIKLYSEIWGIYCELQLLELQGRNNDGCFKKLLGDLRGCIILEKELIDKLIKEYEYDYDKVVYIILNNKDIVVDCLRKRLYSSVILYKLLYDERINSDSEGYRMNKLYNSCFRNMYLVYFSFLQEFIDKEIDDNMKIGLLNFKYYESYFNHDMESVLVLNDFNIPIDNYIDLDLISQIINLSNGMEEVVANYIDMILGEVYDIMNIKDSDYDDSVELLLLIKNKCMIRAGLSLISEDEYSVVYEEINKIIDNKINDENKKSVDVINSILKIRFKDKERVRRLSFGIGLG